MLIHLRDRIYYTSPAKQSYGACFMSLLLTLNLFFVGAQLATLLSTSRAPSTQWFLLAFPFLISLSISNGFLMFELNLQCRGHCAASVSPEVCQREHSWLSSALLTLLEIVKVSAFIDLFSFFFFPQDESWSILVCISFLRICSKCWFTSFEYQIVEHLIACTSEQVFAISISFRWE